MSAEVKSPLALRTIGEVSEDLSVAPHVLRFWEGKFSQIRPVVRRGRRYYRPQDIRVITQIKTLLYGQGYTIRGAQKFLQESNAWREEDKEPISASVATPQETDEAIINDNAPPTEPIVVRETVTETITVHTLSAEQITKISGAMSELSALRELWESELAMSPS